MGVRTEKGPRGRRFIGAFQRVGDGVEGEEPEGAKMSTN